jgi:MFS transporter, DHA1 family, tetracycline resistance protein
VPFYAASCISLLNFAYGWFVLPETLALDKRRPFDWARANPFGPFRVFRAYGSVVPLSVMLFIYFFATSVYPATWSFWGMAKFKWTAATIGLTLAAFGIISAVFQGALTGWFVKQFGERRVALIGLTCAAVAAIGYGFAPSLPIVVALMFVHGPEGLVHPMFTALMSKSVPDDAQGELQGGISSVMNVAMLAGTVAFAQIFGYFTHPNAALRSPDIGFFFCGAILLVALGLFLALKLGKSSETP